MARPSLHKVVDLLPLVLAFLVVGTVGATWWARVGHPYDLEWMEGGMLAHAWRLQQGLPLYPEPGPDFVPFVYPPGYSALLAALGAFVELGHPLGRTVALLATLTAAGAIVFGVARHGRGLVAGLLGAAIFLGTYEDSGAFFDLVRPDSLSMAFLGWAIVVGLERRRGAAVAAGLLLAAAWVCKHNAAAYGFPMLLGIVTRDGWRRGVVFGLSAGLPALAISLMMQLVSEGRFLAYILAVPGSHPMVVGRILPGTPGELGQALAAAVVLGAALVVARAPAVGDLRARTVLVGAAVGAVACAAGGALAPYPSGVLAPTRLALVVTFAAIGAVAVAGGLALARSAGRRALPWEWVYGLGVGAVALVTAGLMRGHHGGFLNVLMPLHWVVAFAAGMAAARLRARWPTASVSVAVALVLTFQLGLQWSRLDVERLVPTAEDVAAGDRVVERIRARCDGPVLSPYAAWLPVQAGLAPSLHLIAVWDINHSGGPFRPHMATLREAAETHHWDCVVEGGRQSIGFGVNEHYRLGERLPVRGRELMPRTGWRVRPGELHVPR